MTKPFNGNIKKVKTSETSTVSKYPKKSGWTKSREYLELKSNTDEQVVFWVWDNATYYLTLLIQKSPNWWIGQICKNHYNHIENNESNKAHRILFQMSFFDFDNQSNHETNQHASNKDISYSHLCIRYCIAHKSTKIFYGFILFHSSIYGLPHFKFITVFEKILQWATRQFYSIN